MKFAVDPLVWQKFIGLEIGVLVARGIDNVGTSSDILKTIQNETVRIRLAYTAETLVREPKLEAWRNAYRSFGANPKENRSSV